jgi:hypothetical protein
MVRTTMNHLSEFFPSVRYALPGCSHPLLAENRYPTMTRFFAHLCLYLQMIDITVSPLAIQIILEAYLQVLEVRHYHRALTQLA